MPADAERPRRTIDAGTREHGKPATITRLEFTLLILIAVVLRVTWMILVHAWTDPVDLGEATNAMLAFARQGVVADAYFVGQGPTAHLLPTMIVVAGTIERLLGPQSAAANLALCGWALVQMVAGFGLTTLLFRRLGADRRTLLGGLGLLCLLPVHIVSEAADFRVWEGGLAYAFAAANLLWMIVLGQRDAIRTRDLTAAALLAAAAFFVNPPVGLAICGSWSIFALSRLSVRQAASFTLLGALAMAAVIVPWTLRNQALLGEPVMLRSNFGLELAIANHDGALDPAAPRAALTARMNAVHQTEERFRAAGGEVAYSRKVGADTKRWIAAHPARFARLTLRHYRQFYVPDTWLEDTTNWNGLKRLRIRAFQVVGILGIVGLIAGLVRRRRYYWLLASYIVVAGLPYAVVQPIPRYGYIVYPLLVFLAVQLITGVIDALRSEKSRRLTVLGR